MRDGKYNLERYRTSTLTKRQNEARYTKGRLYTHLKLHQIKEGVKEVRAKQYDASIQGRISKRQLKKLN